MALRLRTDRLPQDKAQDDAAPVAARRDLEDPVRPSEPGARPGQGGGKVAAIAGGFRVGVGERVDE
ncbi:MAG: hypothetical protein V3S14_01510 [Anaerolineae bacterium]